ncbi:hypothetical protein [Microvirga tunisiensis]|uniref:Cupin domain-containing protein n=1 Tax=Microvirga tunisiensis TaxID=2108360 RepID=A0A5N7MQ82_9HYPH|nr:hypothetical protein [Microvirga tunisiensis]MPR11086.1 hypothetical protein [Microvirga tunisiensis]MPR29177.1 hypothetical protein [Microvirga tunisiensis]
MPHKFITQADLHPDDMDFGRLSFLSHPSTTGTKHPTILAVSVLPSKGHDFRSHPNREELIHVLAGTIEVWVEQKTRILALGLRVRASWGRARRLQRGPGRGQGSADPRSLRRRHGN